MKELFLLLILLAENFIIRFWGIGIYPQQLPQTGIFIRLVSAFMGSVIPVMLYFFLVKKGEAKKTALICAFIMGILPQSVIEGRINSPPVQALFIILFTLLTLQLLKSGFLKAASVLVSGLFLYLLNPFVWLDRIQFDLPLVTWVRNFFRLLSFDTLFFRNETFYWGGIKETGILYLALLPLFLYGIYKSASVKRLLPLYVTLSMFGLFSFGQNFPENRFVLLVFPSLSLLVSRGFYFLNNHENKLAKIILILIFLGLVYEIGYFHHFYFFHYALDVTNFREKVTGPF